MLNSIQTAFEVNPGFALGALLIGLVFVCWASMNLSELLLGV